MSIKTLGVDLSIYHGGSVQDQDAEGIRHLPLRPQFAQIAGEVLDSYLDLQRDEISKTKTIGLQVSTREILPSDDDLLLVDAVALFAQHGVCSPDQWARLEKGLLDIKKKIAERFGRPRIRISGSKHLTASYLVGRCFPAPSGFRLEIRTHTDVWSTDYPTAEDQPFEVSFEQGSPGSTAVYVEVDATGNPVHKAVQRYVRATGYSPHLYVKLHPKGGSRRGAVTDNGVCVAMARQVRDVITSVSRDYPIDEVHLFAAVPQQLAVMIGHYLNATLPVQLYEFDGQNYCPSYRLNDQVSE